MGKPKHSNFNYYYYYPETRNPGALSHHRIPKRLIPSIKRTIIPHGGISHQETRFLQMRPRIPVHYSIGCTSESLFPQRIGTYTTNNTYPLSTIPHHGVPSSFSLPSGYGFLERVEPVPCNIDNDDSMMVHECSPNGDLVTSGDFISPVQYPLQIYPSDGHVPRGPEPLGLPMYHSSSQSRAYYQPNRGLPGVDNTKKNQDIGLYKSSSDINSIFSPEKVNEIRGNPSEFIDTIEDSQIIDRYTTRTKKTKNESQHQHTTSDYRKNNNNIRLKQQQLRQQQQQQLGQQQGHISNPNLLVDTNNIHTVDDNATYPCEPTYNPVHSLSTIESKMSCDGKEGQYSCDHSYPQESRINDTTVRKTLDSRINSPITSKNNDLYSGVSQTESGKSKRSCNLSIGPCIHIELNKDREIVDKYKSSNFVHSDSNALRKEEPTTITGNHVFMEGNQNSSTLRNNHNDNNHCHDLNNHNDMVLELKEKHSNCKILGKRKRISANDFTSHDHVSSSSGEITIEEVSSINERDISEDYHDDFDHENGYHSSENQPGQDLEQHEKQQQQQQQVRQRHEEKQQKLEEPRDHLTIGEERTFRRNVNLCEKKGDINEPLSKPQNDSTCQSVDDPLHEMDNRGEIFKSSKENQQNVTKVDIAPSTHKVNICEKKGDINEPLSKQQNDSTCQSVDDPLHEMDNTTEFFKSSEENQQNVTEIDITPSTHKVSICEREGGINDPLSKPRNDSSLQSVAANGDDSLHVMDNNRGEIFKSSEQSVTEVDIVPSTCNNNNNRKEIQRENHPSMDISWSLCDTDDEADCNDNMDDGEIINQLGTHHSDNGTSILDVYHYLDCDTDEEDLRGSSSIDQIGEKDSEDDIASSQDYFNAFHDQQPMKCHIPSNTNSSYKPSLSMVEDHESKNPPMESISAEKDPIFLPPKKKRLLSFFWKDD